MRLCAFLVCIVLAISCGRTPKHPVVVMETSLGTIELTLDAEKAPGTVKNFLSYVDDSFYDDTIFHRVIPGFMIQGGGFDTALQPKITKSPIRNEAGNGLVNKRGSIAMARTEDLNSATSQFYINHRNNFPLDEMKYAVFGEVTAGMDVVDKIAEVPTRNVPPFANLPVESVVSVSVRMK